MNRIKKFRHFESFVDDLDFINESNVFYLPSFTSKLKDVFRNTTDQEIKNLIKTVLDSEGKNLDSDTTFIGLADDTDMCSFSKEREIKSKYPDESEYLFNEKPTGDLRHTFHPMTLDKIERTQTQRLKIGKLIKKIVPTVSDKDLENLVNLLKTYKTGYEIKVVEGDEIARYYSKDNCLNSGTLGNSCMAGKGGDIKHIFDIYTKNPQSVKLVVMLDKSGTCVARALLWKIDELFPSYGTDNLFKGVKVNDFHFMDRVYFAHDWMERYMFNWAQKQNIPFKYGSKMSYKDGYVAIPSVIIKLKPIAYRNFPYIDTFSYYNVKNATLSNHKQDGDFEAGSVQGSFFGGTKANKARNFIRRFKDYI
jgi:hypothetical protein